MDFGHSELILQNGETELLPGIWNGELELPFRIYPSQKLNLLSMTMRLTDLRHTQQHARLTDTH